MPNIYTALKCNLFSILEKIYNAAPNIFFQVITNSIASILAVLNSIKRKIGIGRAYYSDTIEEIDLDGFTSHA